MKENTSSLINGIGIPQLIGLSVVHIKGQCNEGNYHDGNINLIIALSQIIGTQ